ATLEVGALVGLGDACPLVSPTTRTARKNGVTEVRARWASCPGFDGVVRAKLRVTDGCTTLVGRVVARNYRRNVTARRTDCGDAVLDTPPPATPFAPTLASLGTHAVPAWFDDAKFGIMIHWGIFDVPAWAETVIDPHEWLCCGKLLDPPDF